MNNYESRSNIRIKSKDLLKKIISFWNNLIRANSILKNIKKKFTQKLNIRKYNSFLLSIYYCDLVKFIKKNRRKYINKNEIIIYIRLYYLRLFLIKNIFKFI